MGTSGIQPEEKVRMPHVDDRVRLLDGVPGTALARGQVGIICSEWAGCKTPTYEVEFVSEELHDVSRRLLTLEQIAIADEAVAGV